MAPSALHAHAQPAPGGGGLPVCGHGPPLISQGDVTEPWEQLSRVDARLSCGLSCSLTRPRAAGEVADAQGDAEPRLRLNFRWKGLSHAVHVGNYPNPQSVIHILPFGICQVAFSPDWEI